MIPTEYVVKGALRSTTNGVFVLCVPRFGCCRLQLGFAQQLDDMIAEAEQVATDLYGETQSPQDMQVQPVRQAVAAVTLHSGELCL